TRTQMVEDLIRSAVAAVGYSGQTLEVISVEVADTPVHNLAGLLQGLETRHRFGQGMRSAPMQEIEIKAVRLKPLQAALAGRHRALARCIMGVDLAHEVNAIPQAAHRLPDDLLSHALAVHFGRVDQPNPKLKPQLERRHFVPPVPSALSHPACAKPQSRKPHTRLERSRSHFAPLRSAPPPAILRMCLPGSLASGPRPSNNPKKKPIRLN